MYPASKNMVSVFMLTYNQELVIGQTIESILSQKTNFPFNIVIGEDCSTDSTLEIVQSYKEKHPEKIKLITSDKNIGLIKNFIRTIKECDGKYIAICDGDDYWIDNGKLQMQVDFLEKNQDFSIVFTNKNDLYSNGQLVAPKSNKPEISGFEDLVKGNYIASVTVLFKNRFYKKELPKWLEQYPYGDWPIYLMTVRDGSKIKFLDVITANYRKDAGITSNIRRETSKVFEINLNILRDIYKDSAFKPNEKLLKKSIVNHEIELMKSYNRESKYLKAFVTYFKLILRTDILNLKKQYLYSLLKSLRK